MSRAGVEAMRDNSIRNAAQLFHVRQQFSAGCAGRDEVLITFAQSTFQLGEAAPLPACRSGVGVGRCRCVRGVLSRVSAAAAAPVRHSTAAWVLQPRDEDPESLVGVRQSRTIRQQQRRNRPQARCPP